VPANPRDLVPRRGRRRWRDNKNKRRSGSNGEARGLFAGGPHWLFGPRIIIIAVALLPFVSAWLCLSFSPFFSLSLSVQRSLRRSARGSPQRPLHSNKDRSLALSNDERPASRSEHARRGPSGPEDGRHAEDRRREGEKGRDILSRNGEAWEVTDATRRSDGDGEDEDGERGEREGSLRRRAGRQRTVENIEGDGESGRVGHAALSLSVV